MRERLVTFGLAIAALVAFYGLWLRPTPSLDLDASSARPTTAERRGNGYAALDQWLQRSGVPVRSWRERYTALPELDEVRPVQRAYEVPEKIPLSATGPHPLLAGVKTLGLETDYEPDEWSLRMPYDNFVLVLARTASGEGAMFEQRLGAGRILLVSGGTLFTNRALANDDNAALFANIVAASVAPGGVVLFDDLRQGLSASYDPARFYSDSRLYKTIAIMLAVWLVWVLGGTRLRAPVYVTHPPSEAELVRRAGGLIARAVPPWHTARALFDQFFEGVARAARGALGSVHAERGELWSWLERHAAVLPQELDQLKSWYADAHSERKLPLVPLANLLDNLGKRLKT
jgi:hypothetical protein